MAVLSRVIFDLVDRIASASTVSDVWDAYLGATREVGLSYALACVVPQKGRASFQVIADALPNGCLEAYLGNRLYSGDLLAERARMSTASFEWKLSDWDVSAMTPVQKRWRKHCVTFGIAGGLCILDFQLGREMMLAVCGSDTPLAAHDRLALYFAGHEALQRLREITATEPAGLVLLSQRERQCLEWAAAGKTDWEIAQLLSLSEKTVNVYIDRARSKFGVKSRAQAIRLASKAGKIAF